MTLVGTTGARAVSRPRSIVIDGNLRACLFGMMNVNIPDASILEGAQRAEIQKFLRLLKSLLPLHESGLEIGGADGGSRRGD